MAHIIVDRENYKITILLNAGDKITENGKTVLIDEKDWKGELLSGTGLKVTINNI